MSDPIQRAQPKPERHDPHRRRPVFLAISSMGWLALVAGVVTPAFFLARGDARKNSCLNNLRQIRQAKESWALANKKTAGEEATIQDVALLMTGWPECPGGGAYALGKVGEEPRCSLPNHFLSNPQKGR